MLMPKRFGIMHGSAQLLDFLCVKREVMLRESCAEESEQLNRRLYPLLNDGYFAIGGRKELTTPAISSVVAP